MVSSSSSPSPSASCADGWDSRGGVSSAGVSPLDESVPAPLSAVSAGWVGAGGAPKEKPANFGAEAVPLDSASGVRGGLPKPKPTGLPMLPAVAPKVNGADFDAGGGVLKLNPPPLFVGVEVSAGLSEPNVRPPPKILLDVLVVVGFSASFSFSSLSFELSLVGVVKRLLEKIDGDAADELSAGLPDGKENEVEDEDEEDGAPNVKADLGGAAEELPPEVADDEPNVKEDVFVRSMEGLKPPAVLVEEEDAAGAAGAGNPANPDGGAGIAGGALLSEPDGASGFAPKLNGLLGAAGGIGAVVPALVPNDKADVALDDAAAGVGDGETFLISCSYSSLTFDRKDLYCSSTVARSRNGSESTDLVIASTNDTLRPRRER